MSSRARSGGTSVPTDREHEQPMAPGEHSVGRTRRGRAPALVAPMRLCDPRGRLRYSTASTTGMTITTPGGDWLERLARSLDRSAKTVCGYDRFPDLLSSGIWPDMTNQRYRDLISPSADDHRARVRLNRYWARLDVTSSQGIGDLLLQHPIVHPCLRPLRWPSSLGFLDKSHALAATDTT